LLPRKKFTIKALLFNTQYFHIVDGIM